MVDNSVGRHVVRTGIAFGIIDAIAVSLRLLARWRSNLAFGADDALIIASLAPQFAMIVIGHFSVEAGGMGISTSLNLELAHGPSRISTLLKLMMLGIITYTVTITLVKLSILILYRRIFPTPALKKSVLIVGSAVIFWFIVALFTDNFQCRPFQAAFDPKLVFTDQCINLEAYYRGITASNLCIDIAILYMPLHMVWGLKLHTRQKLALSGIFLLGSVACVAGAMRIVKVGNMRKDDLTYTIAFEYLWSQVEPALAILCACLMTLRPLFTDLNLILSKLSTRFSRSKSSKTSSSAYTSKEGASHLQWPGTQPRQEDSRARGYEIIDTKRGLHIVSVYQGMTARNYSYIQI